MEVDGVGTGEGAGGAVGVGVNTGVHGKEVGGAEGARGEGGWLVCEGGKMSSTERVQWSSVEKEGAGEGAGTTMD